MRPAVRLALLALPVVAAFAVANPPEAPPGKDPFEAALPNEALMTPVAQQVPIVFVARSANAAEWDKLAGFWTEVAEPAGKVVKIKVPLGLGAAPPVPAENPMTVAKWDLGKRLYYDKILSSNNTVSCATCHDPAKGFGDQRKASVGIHDKVGGVNSPTVINSAFHKFQFWDGRGASLEEQAQGPVGNASEMFGGEGDPWDAAVARLRKSPRYVTAFVQVFGHAPTKDAAAKAVACYERTVLSGNSLHDRAEVAARQRVAADEAETPGLSAADYAKVLKDAAAAKDAALDALGVTGTPEALGQRLNNGRVTYFGKARCATCHIGDNFTDNLFHNLGVGVKEGKLPDAEYGRYTRLPTGHKDATQVGAFKTPGLRALVKTAPYMHDGGEKTLDQVVEFYDRGGTANEFLDAKMRDAAEEEAYTKALSAGQKPELPKGAALTRAGKPVVPLALKLTAEEKADLVLFLRALEGDAVDPVVADPAKFPAGATATAR